jgi:hypothetical protein
VPSIGGPFEQPAAPEAADPRARSGRCYGWLVPIASFLRRLKRAVTPPGNRPPIDQAGQTRKAPTGLEPPSMGGERQEATDRWERL